MLRKKFEKNNFLRPPGWDFFDTRSDGNKQLFFLGLTSFYYVSWEIWLGNSKKLICTDQSGLVYSKMFNITSKYFSFFNNKPTASWVDHITRDFLTCYSRSMHLRGLYKLALGPKIFFKCLETMLSEFETFLLWNRESL